MEAKQDEAGGKSTMSPKRMAGGVMLIGTALGASLMAAKMHNSKTPLQKFIKRMSK